MTDSYITNGLSNFELISLAALVHGLQLAEEDGDHPHHGGHEVDEQ